MRTYLTAAMVLLALLASSCGKESAPADVPLLHVVPSDAVSVAYYSSCEKCLSRMVDSTDAFRSIDFGSLAERPAVFSYNSGDSLIPMLAVDAGADSPEDSLAVENMIASLSSQGFRYKSLDMAGSHVVVVSRSEELLSAVNFHIASGESIMSSDGFDEVFCGQDALYVRNSTASPLVKALIPRDYARRKRISRYIKEACEWVALKEEEAGEFRINTFCSPDSKYFVNVFTGLDGGVSLMPETENAEAFIDLVLDDWHKYRANFELYLDSRNRLVELKSQKAWAEGFRPEEVAKFCWEGSEVLMARGYRMKKDTTGIVENAIRGYIPALFGSALGINDDSFSACAGGWLITGSAEDIAKYLNLNKPETLPERGILAKVKIGPEGRLCWTKRGINLYVY